LPRKEWLNLRMDMNNFEKNIQDYSQNIKKYVAEVLSILLPNFDNPGSTMGGGLMPLRSLNRKFIDSEFEYKGDFKFMHYTKFQSLLNILKNKSLRLYSLNSMEDNWEFYFAHQAIKSNNPINYNWLRSQLFCFSMCEFSEEQLYNKVMWDIYSNSNEGCCIVFSINNDNTERWGDFSLGRIQYKKHDFSEMGQLGKFMDAHHDFVKKNKFPIANYDTFLSAFLSYFKIDIYSHEKEIRLLKYCEKGNYGDKWYFPGEEKYIDCFNNRQYFELPFTENNACFPKIRIEQVFLHPSLSNDAIKEHSKKIKSYQDDICVERSPMDMFYLHSRE